MVDSKILLPESEIPRKLVQRAGRRAHGPSAGAASGHRTADRPRRSGAAVSDGPDPAGGVDRPRDPDPGRGHRCAAGCGGRPRFIGRIAWSAPSAPGSRIYYKNESVSPAGSHKPNTAVAQAYYNAKAGRTASPPRPAPASGAAPWRSPRSCSGSSARSTWCGSRTSRSRTGASMMETWGRERRSQPVADTNAGRADARGKSRLARQPRHRHLRGGRGRGHARGHELLARSVLNHVLLHQTVIGQEAQKQIALAGENGPTSWSAASAAAPTSAVSRCRSSATRSPAAEHRR